MLKNDSNNVYNWYILYTLPNFEKKVHEVLKRKNIKSFLPLHKVTKQWCDRRKTLELPLFPNYIFVYTTEFRRYDFLKMHGIVRYLTHCKKPVIISEQEIENIEKLRTYDTVQVDSHFIKGDKIVITDGPFTNFEGIIFERKGKTRVGINILGLNQFLSVEVCSSSIVRKAS